MTIKHILIVIIVNKCIIISNLNWFVFKKKFELLNLKNIKFEFIFISLEI